MLELLKILRDPVWQFLGIIFATSVAITTYLLQRKRKALSYEILACFPLLSVREEIGKKLQIFFDKKPVRNVSLFVIKITNPGNLPIPTTDYERPIILNFGKKAQVLTAEVTEAFPNSLRVPLTIKKASVILSPILLNPKDSITIKTLVGQSDGYTSISARIVGVKEIKRPKKGSKILTLIGMLVMGIGITIYLHMNDKLPTTRNLVLLSIIFLGFFLALTGISRSSPQPIKQSKEDWPPQNTSNNIQKLDS